MAGSDPALPIFVAGDLFHRYNEPAELVNFLLRHMPNVYAVPGNHDLSHHNIEELHRSAFWTLVESGKVNLLNAIGRAVGRYLIVWGFPCGGDPVAAANVDTPRLKLAVIHAYCYQNGMAHPQAKPEEHWSEWAKRMTGYDVLHFGDNHKLVLHSWLGRTVFNAGTFIRQRSDERGNKPLVGILMSDGTVYPHLLDTSADKWNEGLFENQARAAGVDARDFLDALTDIGAVGVDYAEAVKEYVCTNHDKLTPNVRWLLVEIMESCNE